MSQVYTKSTCRKLFQERRMLYSPGMLHAASDQIQSLLFSSFNLEDKTVSLFMPIERKREINTYLILERAISIGARVCIPKADFKTRKMTHYLYEHAGQLEITDYGIPEPKNGTIIPAKKIDIVLVPLIACDKKGYRVGYGMGFYDRFMASCAQGTIFIGLSLFDPIDVISDVDENDRRLHYCITPEQKFTF